jgi:hypothetical protein
MSALYRKDTPMLLQTLNHRWNLGTRTNFLAVGLLSLALNLSLIELTNVL